MARPKTKAEVASEQSKSKYSYLDDPNHQQPGESDIPGTQAYATTHNPDGSKKPTPRADVATPGIFDTPGVGEQKQQENVDFFGNPSRSASALPGLQGSLAKPGSSEAFFAKYGTQATDPSAVAGVTQDLNPYYDFARMKATSDLNDQLAARGGYGSSAGIGMIGNTLAQLGAEQANREADFQLDRAGKLDDSRFRGLELGGSLADKSQLHKEARDAALFEAAGQVDRTELDRIQEEFDQAYQSQQAADKRADDEWRRENELTGQIGSVIEQDINTAISGAELRLGISSALLASAKRASNVAPEQVAKIIDAAPDIATLARDLGVPESMFKTKGAKPTASAGPAPAATQGGTY